MTINNKFNNFISKHNILTAIICILVASSINELVNEFFDGIVINMINDNHRSKKKIEDAQITIINKKIKVGKFSILILKLLIVLLIVVLLEHFI